MNGRNKVTTINTWAVAIFRNWAGIIQWKASELKDLDKKSRKSMMMYGGFYVANSEENLIRGVSAETINMRVTISTVEFKKQKAKELKEKWSEKRMHGQFIRETMEKAD